MRCRCGESRWKPTSHSFRRTVGGTVFTATANVDACEACGEHHVPAALILAFERALAAEVARRGPVSGETFRWVRRAAGLERGDLIHLLGLSAETIGAWEEERRSVDLAAWTVVAALALDAIEGPRPLRTRMKRRSQAIPAGPSLVVDLDIDPAPPATLSRALDLLATPARLTDADVADALDLDVTVLRTQLGDLARLGLVASTVDTDRDALSWDVLASDRAALTRAASDANVDLEIPLPRAKRADGNMPAVARRSPASSSRMAT